MYSSSRHTIQVATALILLAVLTGTVLAGDAAARDVTLQLKWRHQFQFAGFYAAIAKGYYEEAGLNVTLKERTPDIDTADEVLAGRADFGIGNTELILDYAQGKELKAVGVIFQHAPNILLSRADSNITSPRDLRGKRVMLSGTTSAILWAMLISQGVTKEDITVQNLSWTIDDLVAGKTDAMSAYLTDQPYGLKQAGVTASIMRPLTYGIDFYGDLLFTSRSLARDDPGLVESFAKASYKGWEYAMAHTEEIIDLILTNYQADRTRAQLRFEAEAMRELILPQLVEIGTMSRSRWEHIVEVYTKLGMLESPPAIDDFLYEPVQQRRLEKLARWAPWLTGFGVLVIMAAGGLLYFNRRLQIGISERTRELDRNRESLRQVLDLVPNMIYAKSREGRFLMVNRTMALSLGSSVESLTGTLHADAHPDKAEIDAMEREEATVFETGFPKVALAEPYQFTDGTPHWLQTTRLPFTAADTGEQAVLVLSVDVTDRRKAEAAIKDSEERFRAIFNQTYQFTAILDVDGTLLNVNESALSQYDADRSDVLDKPFWEGVWWDQGEATRMWLMDCIHRAAQGETIRSESFHHPPGKKRAYIDFSIKPAFNDEGEIIYLITEGRDITNLKLTQEKLRSLNDELEQRVEERTRNLAEAKEELLHSLQRLEQTQSELIMSEKLAALGGLVAGVAHEINTPLGVSVTAASFLDEKLKEIDDKFQHGTMKKSDLEKFITTGNESAKNILTNLQRAAELIKGFKQVAADQSSEMPRSFNLRAYVDEVLMSLHPKFKRTPHVVENKTPDIEMHSYPGAFMQIITNLLMNALMHAFDEDTPGRVEIAGKVEGETLVFTLSDDGKGIDPEHMEKIFEPFYTTKRNRGGTGLGLHIVYNTVTQALNGSISVDSQPGKGTRYTITTPLSQMDENEPQRTPHAEE